VRTFPKELSALRTIVNERGVRLRQLPFAELKQLANPSPENLAIGSRKATIATMVLPLPNDGVRVVIRGFLAHRLMPGKSVALDGFCKYPDETVSEMKPEEFWDFD
jgi:hypothetical protein